MNNNEAILYGGLTWHKEDDGTYTKVWTSFSKTGKYNYKIIEENVNEKNYFKRLLDGTA